MGVSDFLEKLSLRGNIQHFNIQSGSKTFMKLCSAVHIFGLNKDTEADDMKLWQVLRRY